MTFNYPFTDEQLTAIATLPPEVQEYADQYPELFELFADWYDQPQADGSGYSELEIYVGNKPDALPATDYVNGLISRISPASEDDEPILSVWDAHSPVLIRIHGYTLLDRTLENPIAFSAPMSLEAQLHAQIAQVRGSTNV